MPGDPLIMVRVGFFGKLPSRGDFVRMGLSRPTADAWDRWFNSVLVHAEPALRDGTASWQAMAGWRFACGPGVCGPFALTGVWLPSTDRVGRIFPLLIAAQGAAAADDFLDAAETIGAEAIRDAAAPELLLRQLDAAPRPGAATGAEGTNARWWRKGGAASLEEEALPDAGAFMRMLGS